MLAWPVRVMPAAMLLLGVIFVTACAPHQPAPVSTVQRGATYHNYQQGSWSAESYEVRAGDTLYSIAFRANMDVREISRLNNIREPYIIRPGQVLQLRAAPSAVNADTTREVATSSASREPTASQVSNNTPNISIPNDITPPVVSTAQREYGETASSSKPNEIQPIRPVVRARERNIANADLKWQWPTQGRLVRRFSTQEPMNRGLEFAGQRGDAIVAAEAGKVVYVGTALRGYGRLVILKHNDDYITAYGHNEEIMVVEQQWVEAGQQIATMGSSGRNDVRLRFELRFRGNSVNPENYLPRSR